MIFLPWCSSSSWAGKANLLRYSQVKIINIKKGSQTPQYLKKLLMSPMNSVDIYRKPPMFWMLCVTAAAKVFTVWRGYEEGSKEEGKRADECTEHIICIVVQRTPPWHANGNIAFGLLRAFYSPWMCKVVYHHIIFSVFSFKNSRFLATYSS